MPRLVLVRGLPGSGKTTYARKMDGYYHVEADMWFVGPDNVYRFKPLEIGDAHDWCQKTCACALEKGMNVVVSNTFTRLREMKPYFDMAEVLKVPVNVVEMRNNYGNIHNVPEKTLENMRNRWEEYFGK
jgi:predicted kinase